MKQKKKMLLVGFALLGISFVAGLFAIHNIIGMEVWFTAVTFGTGVIGSGATAVGIIGLLELDSNGV